MLDNFRNIDITWDKANRKIYDIIRASSSDEQGRKLVVQVLDNGSTVNLEGTELRLYWETKNKHYTGFDGFELIDAEHGIFELHFTTGMLSNIGNLRANLHLMNTDDLLVITSEPFQITVFRGIDNETLESTNSFTALTEALVRLSRIEDQEESRKSNETARERAEDSRKQAEKSREDAESERKSSEDERLENESNRKSAESVREENESTRQKNENNREDAEDTRGTNEIDRESAETLRETHEQDRESAESTREKNEQTRIINESDRGNNELSRKSYEIERSDNERNREEAEESRESSENLRDTNEEERKTSESNRISNEQSREDEESIRKKNESNRYSTEVIRKINEGKRESTFDDLQQSMEAVEQDYADRAEDLELTYSPRLLEVEDQLENDIQPRLEDLEDGTFEKPIILKANTSTEEDDVFLRLERADGTLLSFLSTGADGTGLKLHMFNHDDEWTGYVSVDEDGTIKQNGSPIV